MYKLFLGLALALAFAACKKDPQPCGSATEKTFANTGFNRINAAGTFVLNLTQGAGFSIKAKGCSNDLDDLRMAERNGVMHVEYSRHRDNREQVTVDITLPSLAGIALQGTAGATLAGFSRQTNHMRTAINGAATCTLTDLPPLLYADVTGTGQLTVAGTASDLIAHVSGAGKLDAYSATFADADVYTSGAASVKLRVQRSLAALASGDSRIYYKGAPTSLSIEESGNGKVIHE